MLGFSWTLYSRIYSLLCLRRKGALHEERESCVLGLAKMWVPGLVNIVPTIAYHFHLALSAAFTQPGARLLAGLCRSERVRDTCWSRYPSFLSTFPSEARLARTQSPFVPPDTETVRVYRVTILWIEHKIASWNVEMYEPTPISVQEEVCVPQSDKINVTSGFNNCSLRVPLSTDTSVEILENNSQNLFYISFCQFVHN